MKRFNTPKKILMVALMMLFAVMAIYAESTPTGESMDEAGCEKHSGVNHLYITGAHSNAAYVCGIAYKTDSTIVKRTDSLGEGFGRSYFPSGSLWGWYYWDNNTSKFVSCDGHHGKHEAGTAWENDATNHWHACKVEGCTDHISNKEAHSFGESGADRYTCTACGYVDHAKQVEANEADAPSGLYMDEAYCTNDIAGTHRQHIYVTDVDGERVICIIYAANGTAPKKSTISSASFVKTSVVELRTGNPGGWYCLNENGTEYVACDGTHGPTHEADTTEWKKDETNHWHVCKAQGCTDTEHISNKAEHRYGESGADRYTCTVCGYVDRAFADFKAQIEAITGEETVTLNKNLFAVTGDATIKIKTGQNVTIDLNGKTIDANGILCPIFEVEKNATLTIKGNGKITGVDGTYAGTVVSLQGTLNLYDATITGNKTTSNGGAVYMYDGTANFTMNSGTISDNSANYGGAIRVGKGNTFVMYGGTISGNTANKSGAIFINEGNASLLGGSITGNASNERGAVSTDTTVTVGGDIQITGNTTNGVENNLFLRIIEKPNSQIKVSTEKPLDGALIGISLDVESDEQLPKEMGIAAKTDCLKMDNDHYVLQVKEGKLSVSPSGATVTVDNASLIQIKTEWSETCGVTTGSQNLDAGVYTISPSDEAGDYKLNCVKLNGETVNPISDNTSYRVTLSAGDTLGITADYEEETYGIAFTPSNWSQAIKKVTSAYGGGTELEIMSGGEGEWLFASAAAPAGYKVTVELNEGYASESVLEFYATEAHQIVTTESPSNTTHSWVYFVDGQSFVAKCSDQGCTAIRTLKVDVEVKAK